MSGKIENPQVFPQGIKFKGDECGSYSGGMTLRDFFAAKIIQGFCANPAIFASNAMNGWQLVNCSEESLIKYAYRIADKALTERTQTKDSQ